MSENGVVVRDGEGGGDGKTWEGLKGGQGTYLIE